MSDNDTSPPVIDLDNLERLARAATPGPWRDRPAWDEEDDAEEHDRIVTDSYRPPHDSEVREVVVGTLWYDGPHTLVSPADAAFIAAANPAVVLELVRRLREAERPRVASCPVCGCDEVAQTKDVAELQERLRSAGELVAALQDEVDRERTHRARRGAGGQQVPNHGDFAGAAPSTLGRLDWWARALRGALGATSTDR